MGEGEGGGAEDMRLSQRGALYYANDITIILLCKRRRKTPCNPDSMIQTETNKKNAHAKCQKQGERKHARHVSKQQHQPPPSAAAATPNSPGLR
jgi:hypothetical protein